MTAALDAVYEPLLRAGIPRLVCNFATAELIKSASNAYLATKVSFINAVAELCDASGADVTELSEAMGLDPRIGGRYLHAGLGFGGGCLPKDIRRFRAQATALGVDCGGRTGWPLVDSVNLGQRAAHGGPGSRDLCGGTLGGRRRHRAGRLLQTGHRRHPRLPRPGCGRPTRRRRRARHRHGPQAAINNAWLRYPQLRFEASTERALDGAELVLLLTEWESTAGSPRRRRANWSDAGCVLDARNALDAAAWTAAGWTVHGLGRSAAGSEPGPEPGREPGLRQTLLP